MAPRRAATAEFVPDILDEAVQVDRQNTADVLMEALETLSGFDQSSIRGILYRIPVPNGKYEWIRDVYPPFDVSEMMRTLKEEIGGGDFALRLMAENKPRKTLHFSIMREPKSLTTEKRGGDTDMFMLMMQMQSENSRQSQASADRQAQMMMTMMQASTQQMVGMMTAVMGNREKVSDLIPVFAAMKGDTPPPNSLKDTVETIAAIQGLLPKGDGSSGFDPEDFVGSALKLAGPLAGAVGKAFSDRRERLNGEPAPQDPGTVAAAPNPRPLMLARPVARLPPVPEARTVAGKFPILDAVRPDIAYFFSRRHDPELAAEAIVAILDAVEGSQEAVNELVGAFAISPDWKADLAGEGIDLRADPEWADQFLAALVTEWSDPDRDIDDPDGGAGSAGDAAPDGGAGPVGLADDAGAELGGRVDH